MTLGQYIKYGAFAFIALFVIALMFGVTTTVPQTAVGVKLHFGKASPVVLQPGLHWKMPFTDEIVPMSTAQVRYDSGPLALKSKDSQEINSNVTVTYHTNGTRAVFLYGLASGDPTRINDILVKPAVFGIAGQAFASYTIDELITKRDELVVNLRARLKNNLATSGLILDDVFVTSFGFSDVYNKSIEEKVSAEQAKLTAQLTLDKEKISAQTRVVVANAQAEANISAANGEATARLTRAEAEAKSIAVQNKALESVSDKYIPYLVASKWDGVLPKVSSSQGSSNIINLPTVGK